MTKNTFNPDEIMKRIEDFSPRQNVYFAWLCAVRALPFFGGDELKNEHTWGDEFFVYLFNIFEAIDVTSDYSMRLDGAYAADAAYIAAAFDISRASIAAARAYQDHAEASIAAAEASIVAAEASIDDADTLIIAANKAHAAADTEAFIADTENSFAVTKASIDGIDASIADAKDFIAAINAAGVAVNISIAAAKAARTAAYAAQNDAVAIAAATVTAADYAAAAAYSQSYVKINFKKILYSDIKAIKNNNLSKLNNDISVYGVLWHRFIHFLENNDCGYWARLYQNLFESGFKVDEKELERRMNAPDEIKEKGAAAVAQYLMALEDQGKDAERSAYYRSGRKRLR